MISYSFIQIKDIIESKYDEFSEELNQMIRKYSSNLVVRKEKSSNANILELLTEIINKERINEDDYGIVASFTIKNIIKEIIIDMDIIKSEGPVIHSGTYKLISINSDLFDSRELENALNAFDDLKKVMWSSISLIYKPGV